MRPAQLWSVIATALAVGALLLAGGAGARTTGAAADLKTAIAAEKKALKALEKGDGAEAKKELEASKTALGSALSGLGGDKLGPARSDVKQAMNADDAALGNLRTHVQREFARSRVNHAIISKESALEWVDHHTAKPPPPNRPPRVAEFKAEFPTGKEGTTTTYTVTASDPDGDKLSYDWTKDQPKGQVCGRFSFFVGKENVVYWDHPGPEQAAAAGKKYSCPHNEDFHPATITVVVSDGKAGCTVTDTHGSQPVPPFDPGEDCKKTGAPGLSPGVAASMAKALGIAIELEQSVRGDGDLKELRTSAGILDRIERQLAKYRGVFLLEIDLHEASTLDEWALVDYRELSGEAGDNKLDEALDLKKDAKARLEAFANKK